MENSQQDLNGALRLSGIAALVTILLVIVCYWFVDKPVAFFVAHNHFANFIFLKWVTYIPAALFPLLFLIYPVLMFRFCKRLGNHYDAAIWNIANSVTAAYFIVGLLKIAFGRTWAVTWTNNNPSLLSNGAYGFHWLHGNASFASFPSGHTAVIIAV